MRELEASPDAGRDPKEWAPRVSIVGGGVAGYMAARLIVAALPRARVTVIDRNSWHHYSACGLTFALEGMFPLEDLVLHRPDEYEEMGIEVRELCEVVDIDLEERRLGLAGGGEVPFDVLVLATGRSPFVPPVPGHDLPGVHTLSNYGDGERILEALNGSRTAVVVGGGAIGLETAVALRTRGLDVTVVEMLPYLLPQMLDPGIAEVVRDHVEGLGIKVLTGVAVGRFIEGQDGRAEAVEVLGERIPADLIVVSAGVRPEASLAEVAGLDRGRWGGFVTDQHLRVTREGEPVEGVYAIGDCAEVEHAVTRIRVLSPLASTAVYGARSNGTAPAR